MGYIALNVKTDKEGILKDIQEIRELASSLINKVGDLNRHIILEESAEDEATADS